MDKEDTVCMYVYVHIYTSTHTMEDYSAVRKKGSPPFVITWLELDIMLRDKQDTERQVLCDIIYR